MRYLLILLTLFGCQKNVVEKPNEPIVFEIPNLELQKAVVIEKPKKQLLKPPRLLATEQRQTPTYQVKPPFSIVFPLLAPEVSSNFGLRFHPIKKFTRKHSGIDLAAPESSHVRTIADGTIVFAGEYAGYGKLVTVQHTEHYSSLYAHLSEIKVYTGKKVKSGELIGRVGSTGHSTGPHLHFEWRVDTIPVDPIKVFPLLAAEAKG